MYVTQDVKQPHEGAGSVAVIDTATNKVVGVIEVGVAPSGLTINRAGTLLYVANLFSRDISVIDVAQATVIDWIAIDVLSSSIQLTRSGLDLYIIDGQRNQVVEMDAATNIVTKVIPVGKSPCQGFMDRLGSRLYVETKRQTQSLSSIWRQGVLRGRFPFAGDRNRRGNTNRATCLSDESGIIASFRDRHKRLRRTIDIPTEKEPLGACIDPSDEFIYVANTESNTVSVIALRTHKLLETISVGRRPVAFGNFIH